MPNWNLNSAANDVLYVMDSTSLKGALETIESQVIEKAMKLTDGNCDAAAQMLGMNRTTLVAKRRRHGLPLNDAKKQGYTGKKNEERA